MINVKIFKKNPDFLFKLKKLLENSKRFIAEFLVNVLRKSQ